MRKFKIAPSILAADAAFLGDAVRRVEDAGVEYLHIDIMDGHFVPNLSFSADTVRALRKRSKLVFDVHLMISEPHKYIQSFAEAGADIITVHEEVLENPAETAELIHSFGVSAGISVKPKTPVERIEGYISDYDLILIMTVEPGFGGQSYMSDMNEKISKARKMIDERKLCTELEVDGGVGCKNIAEPLGAGADVIVAGSAVFGSEDIKMTVEKMRSVAL